MRVLNVAEKPAMARQISGLLARGSVETTAGCDKYCKNMSFEYKLFGRSVSMVMTSVLGHIQNIDFPQEFSQWALTPPDSLFDASVVKRVDADKKGIERNLEQQSRGAQMLVIWTDCDREGEHIGSEIVQICRKANPNIDVYRARYSSVTAAELHRSCENLQRLDLKQVAAVDARMELDLRTGAIFTRYQTLRLRDIFGNVLGKEVISYGSCQFPTLGFIVEQYQKAARFEPEAFWYLELEVAGEGEGKCSKFTWKRGHLFDRFIAGILYERCMADPLVHVVDVETKPTSRFRPFPLRTVEFQKAASRYLKLSSHKVMDIAEKLYNQGLISYPRTETDVFEFGAEQLKALVGKQAQDSGFGAYASGLLSSGGFRTPRRGKNNDKAHPPIHPTAPGTGLTGQERAVFEFVARRFLACCSEDAKGQETVVKVRVRDEGFEAKGIKVTEPNYLLVYKYDRWTDCEIGDFRRGEVREAKSFLLRDGKTSVPPLLSEADLITCMDKNGIGTDATIHEHINRIIQRRYALKQGAGAGGGRFVPTRLGMALVVAFDQLGLNLSLTQPKIRAQLERDLSAICEGRKSRESVVQESIAMFRSIYGRMDGEFERMLAIFRKYLLGRRVQDRDSNRHGNAGDDDDDDDDLGSGGPFDAMPFKGSSVVGNARRQDDAAGDGHEPDDLDENQEQGNTSRKRGKMSRAKQPATKRPRASGNLPTVSKTSLGGGMKCDCGMDAPLRRVSKAGPNQGREFHSCAKGLSESRCDFFFWADRPEIEGPRSTGADSFASSRTAASAFSESRCQCGLIMKQTVCKNGANAGRAFAKCPKIVGSCGAFEFVDGGGNGTEASSAAPKTAAAPKKTSRAPKKDKTSKCYKCNKAGHWANACPSG